jgi:hypothetical protein
MEKRGQVKERGWVFGGVFCTTDGTDATEEPQWGGVWGSVYGRFAVRLGDEGCGVGGTTEDTENTEESQLVGVW